MKIFENEDITVEVNHNADMPGIVYNKVLEFYKSVECFSGECCAQSDSCSIDGFEFLVELADYLEFQVKYNED